MLQLAAVFSDHMVLQREKNIVVFGIGEVGAIITVSIPERKLYASTTVKEDGSWRLQFPPQPAGTGLSLFAKDSHTEIHFQDVAIGEVWLAGGQSNMEFPVKNAVNGKLELSRCERSRVRYYHVQRSGVMHAAYFQNERKNRWQMPNPTNVAEWSAVAYLAAKELSQNLGVVVGVIGCNFTGTSASGWVPSADLTGHTALHPYWAAYLSACRGKTDAEMAADYAAYLAYQNAWEKRMTACYQENPKLKWNQVLARCGENRYPGPMGSRNPLRPCGLYKTMLSRVKPYTFDFAPVGATFVKVTVTNADTTTPSGVVCAGLTEIELKTATSKFVTNTSAALSSLTVNGTKVSDSVLAAGSYNTPAIIADVKAEGEGNASVTVLPAHDNVIRVITESEDHVTRKTFTINLGTEQEFPADSDERDYPAADMTGTAGSEQTAGTATEGPKKFAVDGNTSTYWHSNWTPTTVNDLWLAFELQKPTKLDALRYLPRPAGSKNGSVTEYKVQVSDDGTNWTDAGSGTWTTDYGWKLAEFNQPVTTKHVRLKAVHTYADSGNDKFMSASEIRLRKAVDTTDISGATVTVPAKLTVDRVDADHPATFATKDVTVTLGDATLRYGVDYLLDYAGNTAVGKATVTVRGIDKYSGTVAKTFTIELKNAPAPEPTLTSVSVKTKPSKLTYVVGDAFDPAGLVLQLNYDDDSPGTETWDTQTAGDFTFTPALDAKLKVTDKTVTVTYQGKSAVIDITVSQPAPTVSKTDLDKAIKAIEAKNPDSSKYTADSWKTFADAMAHAKAVIGNVNSTQFDIDNALSMLNDARAALKEKPGRIIAIIDGGALSKTGASVAIIASVAAAMLAVGAGVMALRRKRS